jgi:hypothetical protein
MSRSNDWKKFSVVALGLLSLCPLTAQIRQPAGARPRPLVGSLTTFYQQVVPIVIVGQGWTQRIVITDVDATLPVIGTLQFYTQTGDPWQVHMKSQGTASAFLVNLQPGQTLVLDTEAQNTNEQLLGWASLELTAQGLGDVFGQTIFRKQTPGLPDFMCSMVLGSLAYNSLSVFFDNTGGNYTGMGVLTSQVCSFPPCSPVQLQVTVERLDGTIISQRTINQNLATLYWMNLATDFPETAGIVGLFLVEPVQQFSTTLTGFSLQFAGNGAFTVITPFEN